MKRTEGTIEQWLTDMVAATEAPALKKWVVPWHENNRQKQGTMLFIMGVVNFANERIKKLLIDSRDLTAEIKHMAIQLIAVHAEAQKSQPEFSEWLTEAGSQPHDKPGTQVLHILYTLRFVSRALLVEAQDMSKNILFKNALETVHTKENLIDFAAEHAQQLLKEKAQRHSGESQ